MFEITAIWFLGIISVVSAIETMHPVRKKLPRPRAAALVAFLQFAGYALASPSLAAFCALAFWTWHTTSWLVCFMFAGLLMCFSSGMWIRPRTEVRAASP